VGRGAVPFSLVLKVVAAPPGEDAAGGVNFWRREFLAYQTRLLADLPAGISAPRCFGAVEHPAVATWLWLEDIREPGGPAWGRANTADARGTSAGSTAPTPRGDRCRPTRG
jgi:hypothetical protein